MKRNLICILCPRGCGLTVDGCDDVLKVTGNSCPKGEKYAIEECTHPTRTVTSIVRVENGVDTMVSVKTSVPIPKESISDVMRVIRGLSVKAPVHMGEILCADVCGADIIATKEVL